MRNKLLILVGFLFTFLESHCGTEIDDEHIPKFKIVLLGEERAGKHTF